MMAPSPLSGMASGQSGYLWGWGGGVDQLGRGLRGVDSESRPSLFQQYVWQSVNGKFGNLW